MGSVSALLQDGAGLSYDSITGKWTYAAGTESPALLTDDLIIVMVASINGSAITGSLDPSWTEDMNLAWHDLTLGAYYNVLLGHYFFGAGDNPSTYTAQASLTGFGGALTHAVGIVVHDSGGSETNEHTATGSFTGPSTDTTFDCGDGVGSIDFGNEFDASVYHTDVITGLYSIGAFKVYFDWVQGGTSGVINHNPDQDKIVTSGLNIGAGNAFTHNLSFWTPKLVVRASHRVGRHHRLSVS